MLVIIKKWCTLFLISPGTSRSCSFFFLFFVILDGPHVNCKRNVNFNLICVFLFFYKSLSRVHCTPICKVVECCEEFRVAQYYCFFLCFVYFHHQEESTWEMQELLGDTSNASVEMDGWMHTAHGEREKGVT